MASTKDTSLGQGAGGAETTLGEQAYLFQSHSLVNLILLQLCTGPSFSIPECWPFFCKNRFVVMLPVSLLLFMRSQL